MVIYNVKFKHKFSNLSISAIGLGQKVSIFLQTLLFDFT